MDTRQALGALSAALLLGACVAGSRDPGSIPPVAPAEGPAPPLHTRIDLPSLVACGRCHLEVWEEWSASLHARAWTNPNARAATDDFSKESCRPCHSPLPVLATGLGRRPAYRDFNQEDGVHCLSCHGRPDGVAAARTVPEAPCRPIRDPRLLGADSCYPCHEPTHQAFQEYETSQAYADGVRCADCHMESVLRAGGRPGFSHGPNGGMNPEFVRRALDWSAAIEGDTLRLTLRNRTGHKFPGEIASRSFLARARFLGAGAAGAGAEGLVATETVVLRRPHRGEPREDDRLLPDEERVLTFPFPAGAEEVELALLFRPLPLLPLEECFELGTWSGRRRPGDD